MQEQSFCRPLLACFPRRRQLPRPCRSSRMPDAVAAAAGSPTKQQNGFSVNSANLEPNRMHQVKSRAGISPDIASCQTAFVEGYFVEGHVPMEDVKGLLSQRPDAVGLAAPGMPLGSPGMEGSGAAGPQRRHHRGVRRPLI
jgi:hypothetical protein